MGRSPGVWSTRERIAALLGEQYAAAVALVVASLLAGLTEAGLLALLAQAAAALVDGVARVTVEAGPVQAELSLTVLLSVAGGLALGRLILQGAVAYLPARIVANMQAQLRDRLFGAFTRASWEVQSRDREGELQELATNQIWQASLGAVQATLLVVAASSLIALVAVALVLNPVAALVIIAVAALVALLLRPLSNLGKRRAQQVSHASLEYAGAVNEAVRQAEESNAFGVAGAMRQQVGRLGGNVRRLVFETQLMVRLVAGVYQSLIYILLVGALGVLYAMGTGRVALLGAVVLLLVRAGTYGQQAQSAYQSVRQGMPYLERLHLARRRYSESVPQYGEQRLSAVHVLSFDHVSFGYKLAKQVLSDISFSVDRGEAVGVVGPSGAGKSTLVQILLGLRTPTSGLYAVDRIPADQVCREDWHRRFAYVPQQARLLHASVADNIRFFRPIDDEAVERAAELAGIHADVMSWTDGYATTIGPRADAISGGQQQRICIARALAAQPDVLILDEPTSALDPHSEALIQSSLGGIRHAVTLFVIAHRMSTLELCERIMVIKDGRLEAFDSASRLRKTNAYYASASQLGLVSST